MGVVVQQPSAEAGETNNLFHQYDDLGYGIAIPAEEIGRFLHACQTNDTSLVDFLSPSAFSYAEFKE